jgi:hypothetical protein
MIKVRYACYLVVLSLCCCRRPYNPPASSSPNSYLVVEGVINPGSDSTIIKLSKTVHLNAKVTLNPLLGATVTVESDNNTSWPLIDVNNTGSYSSPGLNLPASQKYRLRINTGDGHQYLSDMVAVKPTPPIDSIGYFTQNGVINLYVNTHDPANATRYYRWEYNETWQFHSTYPSLYVLDTALNTIVLRTPEQNVYSCFGNDVSSNILLTSTTKLTKDVVYQSPLTAFPINSEKIETKYSILVKQYALTSEAYQFYQNIQKNTEQLGSIFDAQPSQLVGNIHNVANAAEPVIGYITVTNVQSKRVFLTNAIIPQYTVPDYPADCEKDTAYYVTGLLGTSVQDVLINRPITDIPTFGIFVSDKLVGFEYSSSICVDCTLRGTTKTPSFWK